MECCKMSDMEKYLKRFREIVCGLADKMLNRTSISDITLDFIECMIPHHRAAIDMCENLLKYCIDPRLKQIAEAMIKQQTKGVQELNKIRCIICN